MREHGTRGARKLDQEDGPGLRGALDAHGAAMILDDLAHDGQAETGAVGLAGTHKRIKYSVADDSGNAATFIDHADFEGVLAALHINGDSTVVIRSGFAGI